MKVATDYELARTSAARSEPIFYSHFPRSMHTVARPRGPEDHVIGRRYRGLFDDNDGSFVTVTTEDDGSTVIDRDSYGGVPLYYSTTRPILSTDLRLIVESDLPRFSPSALAEYLSTAYLTGGKTIYENIRSLMPGEKLVWDGATLRTRAKSIFPHVAMRDEKEASRMLEAALGNSIDDLLARHPGKILLNLSGGTDSTLLLAHIRHKKPATEILTTTYFHDDWREDLDDWKYAEQAAAVFGSRHTLVKVGNSTICREHRELVCLARCVFHTYAAAFYAQNKAADIFGDRDMPIINGSGPDESMVGTEKVSIADLLLLRSLPRDRWTDHLIAEIDYIKIPERTAIQMLRRSGGEFIAARKDLAAGVSDASDFVEFQRRYHALTILQDHVQELSTVATLLGRPIVFPYLTNDIFRIVFSTRFDVLNAGETYKAILKGLLEKEMPREFVHRKKIGFQSPSRPYFHNDQGMGRELRRLLSKGASAELDLSRIEPEVRKRLVAEPDLHGRYDFLEWTAYNILLLEECRTGHG